MNPHKEQGEIGWEEEMTECTCGDSGQVDIFCPRHGRRC
jgi:hypothetical protein